MLNNFFPRLLLPIALLITSLGCPLTAQISWPEGQVLPSFPEPAQTQDLILLRGEFLDNEDELYLFSSLKGIVNRTQPRIFAYDGDDNAEGRYTWLNSLGLDYVEYEDQWELVTKYKDEIGGIIVYDPEQIHTVNLATMLANRDSAIIASPRLIDRLTSAPYNFPIVDDLRGRFTSKLDVYETLFQDYWFGMERRVLLGIDPNIIKAAVREYAVALGLPTIWLDPDVGEENDLLNKFLATMPSNGHYLGWWPEEALGITRASQFGIPTIPSDYSTNLTVHGGFDREIRIKPTPPKPDLQDKIYVAFILSDGDNLQFVEHLMRKIWSDPERGSVPLGWTISPAMKDAMPGALNYFYDSATENDNLISGPSGLGYVYPNFFPNDDRLADYVARTQAYNEATGVRVTTIWNTITGGIDDNVGNIYSRQAPSLLGLTAQNTGGPLSIYDNSLPGKPLTCNYCWDVGNMSSHIANASTDWNGEDPLFLIIQSQPWRDATPATFKAVAEGLSDDYVVVRPDHLFQLLREENGLPIEGGFNTTSTLAEPPAGFTAWLSFNANDQHIRRAGERGRIDSNVDPVEDAYWNMVPGLAGEGVSFRSRNSPNSYLRHRGGQVWSDDYLDTDLFEADATWLIRPGLADSNAVSFESVNFPGNFIRHRDSELFSEPIEGFESQADATWRPIGAFGADTSTTSTHAVFEVYAPLEISPNPASESISIEGATRGNNYVVYSATGQVYLQLRGEQLEQPVSLRSLPKGVYYLRGIETRQVTQFVKQ